MRIKIVANLGSNDYPAGKQYQDGEIVNEDEKFAMRLVAAGHAVELPPEPVAVEAPPVVEPVLPTSNLAAAGPVVPINPFKEPQAKAASPKKTSK